MISNFYDDLKRFARINRIVTAGNTKKTILFFGGSGCSISVYYFTFYSDKNHISVVSPINFKYRYELSADNLFHFFIKMNRMGALKVLPEILIFPTSKRKQFVISSKEFKCLTLNDYYVSKENFQLFFSKNSRQPKKSKS